MASNHVKDLDLRNCFVEGGRPLYKSAPLPRHVVCAASINIRRELFAQISDGKATRRSEGSTEIDEGLYFMTEEFQLVVCRGEVCKRICLQTRKAGCNDDHLKVTRNIINAHL